MKRIILKKDPSWSDSTDLSIPPNYFRRAHHSYLYKNALYTHTNYEGDTKNDEKSSDTNFIAKYEDDKWHYIGE